MKLEEQQPDIRFDIYWRITGLIVLSGIIIRIIGVTNRYLYYDEIWTLLHYSSLPLDRIFTELATPNNHPLNSLLIKWSYGLFGVTWGIRLPALVSGCLVIPVICTIAWLLFKSKRAVLYAAILTSFNGGLVFYSQQGRGYAIQIFLIALFVMFAVILKKTPFPATGKRYMFSVCSSVAAILSMLTLSTSVLIVFAVLLWELIEHIINIWHKKIKIKDIVPDVVGWSLCGTFTVIWYLSNYSAFQQGQAFGCELNSTGQFIQFCYNTLSDIAPIWIVILMLASGFRQQKNFFMLVWPVIFMLTGALVLKAGSGRVYLVLNVFVICAAAGGASLGAEFFKGKWRKTVGYLLLLIVTGLSIWGYYCQDRKWAGIDWGKAYVDFNKLPQNYYVIYPGCAGYPIQVNFFHEAINRNMMRLSVLDASSLLVCVDTDKLNGVINQREQSWDINQKPGVIEKDGVKGYIYRLAALEKFTVGSIVVIKIGPVEKIKFLLDSPLSDFLLRFNVWLNGILVNRSTGKPVQFDILAMKLTDEAAVNALQQFQKQYHEYVTLYVLKSY